MAETWIIGPEASGTVQEFGGKAAALHALSAFALPIPAWFVITPPAWTTCRVNACDDLQVSVPDDLAQAWIAAATALAGPEGLLAVRSSASDEDGGEHSFAGQLDSFLAVRPKDVIEKIIAVWRSAFSERMVAYRASRGLGAPKPPAVLIQQLVNADTAGVAFSVDPVSGRWGQAVVSAVFGLGTKLVGGDGDADTWRVDRAGMINERIIVNKTHAHRPKPGAGEGVADEAVTNSTAPSLTDNQVQAVAALARQCASCCGRPQDIEWAYHAGKLYLLQSRPITTLGMLPDPDGRPALWDNSNIAESYGGITTPLTYTFARRAYEEVYRQFCRIMGVQLAKIEQHADTFRTMIGIIRGRVYYDLLNWYRVLALLPGFHANRGFMEQMMGVKEGLPPELAHEFTPPTTWERLRDTVHFIRSIMGLVRNQWTMSKQIANFYKRLQTALAEPTVPYDHQRADELVTAYRTLERQLLTRWDAPLVNDFFAMIYYGVLSKLCVSWCADVDGTLQNDLVGGDGGVISAEPAARVRQLAALIRDDAVFSELLRSGERRVVMAAARTKPAFWQALQSYLNQFGDRCLEELKLESLTLVDDPMPLLRSVGHFATRTESVTLDHALTARKAAEVTVAQRLAWRPLRGVIFSWVLKNARARVRDRENLRFERTRLFGRVRHIVNALGQRLHAVGKLDQPRDVYYLELEEVMGFVSGTMACDDLRALARVRGETYIRYRRAVTPADRFPTRGWVGVSNPFTAPLSNTSPADAHGDERKGTGCCPGIVRGHARVVRDPRGVELPAGTILVAERTDPGWIMLFPAAAGLIVERGSLLSHSAIVSRELGLPAVVGLTDATTWICDDDLIELDGATGMVRKVKTATPPPLTSASPVSPSGMESDNAGAVIP